MGRDERRAICAWVDWGPVFGSSDRSLPERSRAQWDTGLRKAAPILKNCSRTDSNGEPNCCSTVSDGYFGGRLTVAVVNRAAGNPAFLWAFATASRRCRLAVSEPARTGIEPNPSIGAPGPGNSLPLRSLDRCGGRPGREWGTGADGFRTAASLRILPIDRHPRPAIALIGTST